MQTVYTYSGRDVAESRRTLAAMVRHEFTDGDVEIEPAGEVRAFIRKGLNEPIMLMRSMNGTGISFRRSWHHIRARRAAVRLLYFILQGEMQVAHPAGSYCVPAGRCALINADEPFYSRTVIGERGNFECALAVVPEHLVLSHMPWAKGLNTSFAVGAEHHRVVGNLLDILSFEGHHLGRKTAEPLAEAFLQAISDSIGDQFAHCAQPSGIVDRRFADIQASIQKYLTCPDLTCDRVAAYCGISPRYLCYVLKANDTSFSDLLWGRRLPKAREWLVSKAFDCYPIHKIARMAGFKSAAHFSRMFKTAYGVSPKDYRNSARAIDAPPARERCTEVAA
ncbi:MAG TPA: helix-turn-helix transcriptional regulator [Steroidobacteraceae bacterium]|nr:helix-turn-helix transcriptional regulator [Steroidobacteraceae bacterium]